MDLRVRMFVPAAALIVGFTCQSSALKAQKSQTTTRTTTTYYQTGMNGPFTVEANRARALAVLQSADLGKDDIASILGLLRDLRHAQSVMRFDVAVAVDEPSGETRQEQIARAEENYRNTSDDIWKTISDRIGADKANTVRSVVDADFSAPATAMYTSETLTRIDTILTEWNTRAGVPTVTRTTTVTTQMPARAHVTTVPVYAMISTSELIELLENKLVLMTGSSEASTLLQAIHGDIDSPDLKWAWEESMHVFD